MKCHICLIYNYAQHYRTNIFTLLDQNLAIDFVFGDRYLNVKKMDYSLLHHKVSEVKNVYLGPFFWQKGTVSQVFKGYDKFILLGEPMNISTWIILIIGKLIGKEVYFWSHGWYGKESWLKAKIKKIYFGIANGSMVYGNYARDLMIKEGLRADKISVIFNSLLYDKQLEIRDGIESSTIYTNHFGNNQPILIMIGRLNLRKHLNMLIEATALLRNRNEFYNIVLIGDGEDKEKLKQMTIEKGLQKQIWFYGACYDEKRNAELLYNADMCVVPGDIGLTAIHSLMFGVPALSHNCFKYQGPEFEAIKPGITGDFYEYGSVKDLADTISKWFSIHSEDREKVRQACFHEIDSKWNPHIQLEIIKKAIGE